MAFSHMNQYFRHAILLCWLSLLPLASAQKTAGQNIAHLETAETKLRFEAGPHSPRLSSFQNGTEIWENRASEPLIQSVDIGSESVPVIWNFNSSESHADSHKVTFVYDSTSPRLHLTWEWEVRADHGPIEHQIRIENRDSREMLLPLQSSFGFDFKTLATDSFEQFYVEKGADTPSAVGTHLVQIQNGYRWEGTSSTYAQPRPGEAREIIPYMLVESTTLPQTGFYVGIEFSGRTHLTLERTGESLRGEVGLNPEAGEFRTRLKPGEAFETPRIFLGATHGGPDATGNILRRWVREVLTSANTWKNPQYPFVVNNSWGGGMKVNEEIVQHMIRDAGELGFEMFHLDAGWFRGVGDWQPDPTKFPHGLGPVADEAHARGLKFGLWVDWTQAALGTASTALNVRSPKVREWLTTDLPATWKPDEFKGQTIDIADPSAEAWAMGETNRIVNDYKLDMLEHDGYLVAKGCDAANHPHVAPDPLNKCTYRDAGFVFTQSSNSTDVSYHATRAYYAIQSNLRQSHPGLLLEVCNDGGRMVDFGSAAHGDYFSITDTYDPLSNRRAFYDASFVLPPAMLEAYVERWPAASPTQNVDNFRYMLRSGMMGWFSVMIDTTSWSRQQHEAAKEEIELYKSRLRPLIRDADLYHISNRPDGKNWDGMEYFDPKTRRGVVFAFHGSMATEAAHKFLLRGLDEGAQYQLRFNDHSDGDQILKGEDLLTKGLTIKLPIANTSEIIFLEELPRR
jgi:alpha-galactosidase